LQINAIKLNPGILLHGLGWKSPIYCDNRLILSFPPIRNYVRDEFSKHIENQFENQMLLPVLTGAIGIGILVAESLEYPLYMFQKLKTRASKPSRGVLQKGQNVVVVEDLISTGNSSLLAVEALRAGANIKGWPLYLLMDLS
jgi:orotate phosphoribosyltransferase